MSERGNNDKYDSGDYSDHNDTGFDAASILFVGGGKMSEAMCRGLLAKGKDPTSVSIADPSESRRKHLVTFTDNIFDSGSDAMTALDFFSNLVHENFLYIACLKSW